MSHTNYTFRDTALVHVCGMAMLWCYRQTRENSSGGASVVKNSTALPLDHVTMWCDLIGQFRAMLSGCVALVR